MKPRGWKLESYLTRERDTKHTMDQRPEKKMSRSFFLVSPSLFLFLLLSSLSIQILEAKSRVSIPDELDDVVDDEEDEAWKEWGKKKSGPSKEKFDPPPSDFSKMDPSEIQAEMMKRHVGPSFGFVKLRLGVPRSREDVPDIAMRWTKVLRTGSIEAKFMAVDVNTMMFSMENGPATEELKDFVLSQPEAYEFKIGEQVYRRPGDPPLNEVVVEKLPPRKTSGVDDPNTVEEPNYSKDEF